MKENVIRVGIVGAGANTVSRHIPGLQSQSQVEVVSVCNRSRPSSERVAEQFGMAQVYEDWQELVAAADSDAIVIGTWPDMHCPVTLAALAAGKHVLCEARMAMNADQARAMHAASVAQPHLIAQIVPAPMTLPVDATIKQRLDDGFLGDLLAVELRDGGSFIDKESDLHWRQDAQRSGINIMALGIWYEAMMRWVGPATRVMAQGKTFVDARRDETGNMCNVQVPDHVDVIAEMACGAQGHFQVSAVAGLAGGADIWLFGSEATLRLTGDVLYGGKRGDSALAEIKIAPENQGRWRVEEEFINTIRGQEVITHTTFADGVKYMEFTQAVARSMASGKAALVAN